jgi:hypothetical protein
MISMAARAGAQRQRRSHLPSHPRGCAWQGRPWYREQHFLRPCFHLPPCTLHTSIYLLHNNCSRLANDMCHSAIALTDASARHVQSPNLAASAGAHPYQYSDLETCHRLRSYPTKEASQALRNSCELGPQAESMQDATAECAFLTADFDSRTSSHQMI